MNAIQTLLHQIIDYAGLFPPAGLPLESVVENYQAYLPGQQRWMLARLIIPAAKLDVFAKTYSKQFPNGIDQPQWKISALIPSVNADNNAFDNAMQAIATFNEQNGWAEVDTVEGKLPTSELIDETCQNLLPSLAAFLEIPWQNANESAKSIQRLAKVDRAETYAKIRTGGVTEDLIPDSRTVASFIHACAAANLGFKATAGLHHPLRGQFALTYETDANRGQMHGFMNVFLAACFARQHAWSAEELTELLESTDPTDFVIGDRQIEYRDQSPNHILSIEDIKSVRESFAISFGSCSFTEPIDDLIQLGWLADAAKTV